MSHQTAPTVIMPAPIRVIKAGYGYEICPACSGYGCHVCKGMGEVPISVWPACPSVRKQPPTKGAVGHRALPKIAAEGKR